MARLSLWHGPTKGNNYKFIDRICSQYIGASGTAILIHKLIGPNPQSSGSSSYALPVTSASPTISGSQSGTTSSSMNSPSAGVDTPWVSRPALGQQDLFATGSLFDGPLSTTLTTGAGKAAALAAQIQDPLYLQNTSNKYDTVVYEMRMCYQMADNDIDLTQFGLMSTDVIYGEVHLNDMLAMIGRKIYAGDVIELPNERDDALLDPNSPAMNRFFVVQDAYRAASGYSATWFPHIWRFKMTPMPASPEYADILNAPITDAYGIAIPGTTVGGAISNLDVLMAINEEIVLQAEERVFKKNFETRQFYVVQPDTGRQYPWIFAGDGIPPNGAQLAGSGSTFPTTPAKGDYYLRTDYSPHALFMWNNGWDMQEQDYRLERWDAASRTLLSFINNKNITIMDDGTTFTEKTSLWQAMAPLNDPAAFPDKVAIWNAIKPNADL